MPVISPQDIQSIMEMLEGLPPEQLQGALQQLESQSEYGGGIGRSANEGFTGRWDNPDPIRAPWAGEHDMPGNWERGQSMANSLAEDAMLRETGRSSRKRTKEDAPEGTYALSRYPGIDYAVSVAETGVGPMGGIGGIGMSPDARRESARKRKEWAAWQRHLAGMPQPIRDAGGWRRRNRAESGMSASDRVNRYLGR